VLVAARVAPLRPDLQRALERDLQLLPPGGGDGGLEVLAGVAESHRRRVRVRAGRLARAVGAPQLLRRAVGMLPALRALDDQASARLLVLAGLAEGRACARTVWALMLLFGFALHPALPAGPVPAAVAGGWAGLLRQVRSRGVVVLRQEPAAAGRGGWLGRTSPSSAGCWSRAGTRPHRSWGRSVASCRPAGHCRSLSCCSGCAGSGPAPPALTNVPTASATPARSMFAGWMRCPCRPAGATRSDALFWVLLRSLGSLGVRLGSAHAHPVGSPGRQARMRWSNCVGGAALVSR